MNCSRYLQLQKEFSDKNQLIVEDIPLDSKQGYYWNCPEGHEYFTSMHSRRVNAGHGSGCPICANHIVVLERSFGFLWPDMLKEWDTENNDKSPFEVSPGSGYKAHWVCSRGHKWKTRVKSRTAKKHGTQCKQCYLESKRKGRRI